jgi:hypothetical protein
MLFKYILNRLKEPSTWQGLIGLVTAGGVSMNPEQVAQVVTLGMAVAGSVGVLTKDGTR